MISTGIDRAGSDREGSYGLAMHKGFQKERGVQGLRHASKNAASLPQRAPRPARLPTPSQSSVLICAVLTVSCSPGLVHPSPLPTVEEGRALSTKYEAPARNNCTVCARYASHYPFPIPLRLPLLLRFHTFSSGHLIITVSCIAADGQRFELLYEDRTSCTSLALRPMPSARLRN